MVRILFAVVGGEVVLVDEVGGFLFDRVSGELLDPAAIELRSVEVRDVPAVA